MGYKSDKEVWLFQFIMDNYFVGEGWARFVETVISPPSVEIEYYNI